jgi:hypothetical protein
VNSEQANQQQTPTQSMSGSSNIPSPYQKQDACTYADSQKSRWPETGFVYSQQHHQAQSHDHDRGAELLQQKCRICVRYEPVEIFSGCKGLKTWHLQDE